MSALAVENTSGQGSHAVVPREIQGWNWGAFLLTWIWGAGNSVRLALIVLIPLAGFITAIVLGIQANEWEISLEVWQALFLLMPFIGFIMAIVLGMKGSEWAWKNKRWDSIEHFRRTQRTWAKWGMGLSVVWIVYLAWVIIPNIYVGHYPTRKDVARIELDNIQAAVTAMMVYNNLDTLPNPMGTATNDMGAFPDATSAAGSADKLEDANGTMYGSGDKNGYLLHGHDETANGESTTLDNYIMFLHSMGTYIVNAAGEVTQVSTAYK